MNRGFWKGVFISCILMLLVLIVSVPFNEQGSATYIIIQLAAVHVLAAMAIIGSLLYFNWDPFRAFR